MDDPDDFDELTDLMEGLDLASLEALGELLLPDVPVERVAAALGAAPGDELRGKFASPESSSALAVNAFGWFLERPEALPCPLPGERLGWRATGVRVEATLRFPWSGGRHPWLDVLIDTPDQLIGVESKRYEPFRSKPAPSLSEAYWRPVWGERMGGYEAVRDALRAGELRYAHLDAAQLVKHAFALRTEANRDASSHRGKAAILLHLHAEPTMWSDGRSVRAEDRDRHRAEIIDFAARVAGDEVAFASRSYGEILADWDGDPALQAHAQRLRERFSP